jgi:hypothetical protein
MGDRVYGTHWPGLAWDLGRPVLERGARLLSISAFRQTAEPFGEVVIGSWGQAELPKITFDLDNTDGAMAALVGQEYLLRQDVLAYLTFPGLSPDDAVIKVTAQVRRWILKKRALTIEATRL